VVQQIVVQSEHSSRFSLCGFSAKTVCIAGKLHVALGGGAVVSWVQWMAFVEQTEEGVAVHGADCGVLLIFWVCWSVY
ncbi:MAG: hypothetical protein B7Z27_01600, partial [Sphingobacteriia bacterium 32-37-4]